MAKSKNGEKRRRHVCQARPPRRAPVAVQVVDGGSVVGGGGVAG
jgi:hypothetical protein